MFHGRRPHEDLRGDFRWSLTSGLQLASEDAAWDDLSAPMNALCSPKELGHGSIKDIVTLRPYPATKNTLKALLHTIVELLRDDQAIPLLESMQINSEPDQRVAARIIQVAGLPASAINNMRGFLTIRQYALYQALHRGDNDCPVPVTECGKFGSNPCDRYPPLR